MIMTPEPTPALYLLPCPLADGPADVSLPQHNLRVINQLQYFVVENLRSARRFLKRCNPAIVIDSLHMVELNEHTRPEDIPAMLDPLAIHNHSIGVISEAGCPAVADPGADLVALAQMKGLRVVPLVGPSSIILSLMASGFNGQNFAFRGYLPTLASARAQALKNMQRLIAAERQTQIFIETPYRNNRLIAELCAALPANLKLCVAADITGSRQSVTTLSIGQWRSRHYDFNKIPAIFLLFS